MTPAEPKTKIVQSCYNYCNRHITANQGIIQTDFFENGHEAGPTGTKYSCSIEMDLCCPIPEMYANGQLGKKALEILVRNRHKLNLDGL